jgi:hypothetical protein
MSRRPLATFVALALALVACDGPGNSGHAPLEPNVVDRVPWQNGVLPEVDANGQVIFPSLPEYPDIALGIADLGTPRSECATVGQYEFSKGWFDDFELTKMGADPNETGIAGGWASYDDLTRDSWHSPGDATWYPGLKGTVYSAWGLPAFRMPGPSCDGTPNDWVMHWRGGLFRKWGGGISHAFTDPVGQYRMTPFDACLDPNADFCPAPLAPDAKVDSAGLPTTAANGDDYLQSHDFFDVTKYDGIAFWARRGPEGSAQTLVILTDKFTSSRLARENNQYCHRVRECHSRCVSGAPCSPDDPTSATPVYRCFDPKAVPGGVLPQLPIAIDTELDQVYPRCGKSACTSPPSYLDRDFDDKPCTPYTYPSADEGGEYCFDPKTDPPPAGRDERCQDGWQTVVQLSADWKFYALPWSSFGQVGFGKKAPYMDLKSIDTLAFGAPMGWADAYFDNVTLYRRKK